MEEEVPKLAEQVVEEKKEEVPKPVEKVPEELPNNQRQDTESLEESDVGSEEHDSVPNEPIAPSRNMDRSKSVQNANAYKRK